jgi:hypothetical protein
MSKPILGWYVVNAQGEQVAWHHTRSGARQLLEKLARTIPHEGPFWTQPEYAQ